MIMSVHSTPSRKLPVEKPEAWTITTGLAAAAALAPRGMLGLPFYAFLQSIERIFASVLHR